MTKEVFHTKPFDLKLAKQGHPVTSTCYPNLKIVYFGEQMIVTIIKLGKEEIFQNYCLNGEHKYFGPLHALQMAPLGYCEDIPVWGGDKLVQNAVGSSKSSREEEYEFIISPLSRGKDFTRCHWPKPERVFPKNAMSSLEFLKLLECPEKAIQDCLNEVIKFNILAGVIKGCD
jgi:hypothetical protein